MVSANLTEPGVRNWIRYALYVQRMKRDRLSNIVFNLGMLVILVAVVSIVLYSRYKVNNSDEHRQEKSAQKEKYIIDKLQRLAAVQSKNGMITNLPTFESFVKG